MTSLELELRRIRGEGRTALVPYLMAGTSADWTDLVLACAHAGADAIEIGVPFSDPMMDGPVIQEAALRALDRDVTLVSVCDDLVRLEIEVPLIVMTYYNIFLHHGLDRSAGRLHECGVLGAIVPDLPLEECEPWREACLEHDVANIMLVAPSTPPDRVARIAATTCGFAYASARMAVTGAQVGTGSGARVVETIRATSDVPTYIGIGITTPEQAVAAASSADGVIVGTALVQRILDGASPADVEAFVTTFRLAIDA